MIGRALVRHAGALVAAGVLLVALAVPPDALPTLPLCPVLRWTGLPCPGCGLSHGMCAVGHGRWADAWAANPWAFPAFVGALGMVAAPLLPASWRARGRAWAGKLAPGAILGMMAWGAWRVFAGWP